MSYRFLDSQRDRDALDRHITGNYGEDQFRDEDEGTCGAGLRGGGSCALDPGHRGRHTSIAFSCDLCGKTRPGRPYGYAPDGE